MARAKLIAVIVLVVTALIVILQNTAQVETKLLFITLTMPRAALLAITMVVGVVVGMLISLGLSSKKPTKT